MSSAGVRRQRNLAALTGHTTGGGRLDPEHAGVVVLRIHSPNATFSAAVIVGNSE